MAGTFTHWMVVEEALDRYARLQQRHHYFSTLLGLSHFVCLGAVGPDYPYLSELRGGLLKEHSWADRMHYENTGDFIRNGVKALPDDGAIGFDVCLAWLCGFATHLVTDSVVHPVVQAIVGPYVFNSGEHRHCELTQDSYIFHEMKGIELNYAGYVRLFEMCSDRNNKDRIQPLLGKFWIETLRESHPTAGKWFHTIDPDDWHKHFLSRIDSASDPLPVFRHLALETNIAYKQTTEFTPDERKRFIEEVRLPGDNTGGFKQDVFAKAVDAVMDNWKLLFNDIEQRPDGPIVTLPYLKNWNLDTGVDEDNPYFWL